MSIPMLDDVIGALVDIVEYVDIADDKVDVFAGHFLASLDPPACHISSLRLAEFA